MHPVDSSCCAGHPLHRPTAPPKPSSSLGASSTYRHPDPSAYPIRASRHNRLPQVPHRNQRSLHSGTGHRARWAILASVPTDSISQLSFRLAVQSTRRAAPIALCGPSLSCSRAACPAGADGRGADGWMRPQPIASQRWLLPWLTTRANGELSVHQGR